MILSRTVNIECSEDFSKETHNSDELDLFATQMNDVIEMVIPTLTDDSLVTIHKELSDLVLEYASDGKAYVDLVNLGVETKSGISLIDLTLTLQKGFQRISPTLHVTIFNT